MLLTLTAACQGEPFEPDADFSRAPMDRGVASIVESAIEDPDRVASGTSVEGCPLVPDQDLAAALAETGLPEQDPEASSDALVLGVPGQHQISCRVLEARASLTLTQHEALDASEFVNDFGALELDLEQGEAYGDLDADHVVQSSGGTPTVAWVANGFVLSLSVAEGAELEAIGEALSQLQPIVVDTVSALAIEDEPYALPEDGLDRQELIDAAFGLVPDDSREETTYQRLEDCPILDEDRVRDMADTLDVELGAPTGAMQSDTASIRCTWPLEHAQGGSLDIAIGLDRALSRDEAVERLESPLSSTDVGDPQPLNEGLEGEVGEGRLLVSTRDNGVRVQWNDNGLAIVAVTTDQDPAELANAVIPAVLDELGLD